MLTPETAVTSWWQAMQDQDVDTLTELTLPDYISSGGPDGRTLGRDELLAQAAEFFAAAQIDHWSVTELETRTQGQAAVCAYRWVERGTFDDQPFELSGLATDVLVRQSGTWRHLAHHVSMLPGEEGSPASSGSQLADTQT